MTHTLEELAQRLAQSEARLELAEQRQQQAEQRQSRSERRARVSGIVAAVALGATLLLNVRPVAFAQTPGVSLASLESAISSLTSRVTALETKTAPMTTTAITTTGTDGNSHSGYLVTFTGANVQIVNGLHYTNGNPNDIYNDVTTGSVGNGLGNLIIGYNELRADNTGDNDNGISSAFGVPETDARTGSHNLVIGAGENYTGVGGIIAGDYNEADSTFTSVIGGNANIASGAYTFVSGGENNTASGYLASVSGGGFNQAQNSLDTVSGGESNIANGGASSVSGGTSVTESTAYGWAAGGHAPAGAVGTYHSP